MKGKVFLFLILIIVVSTIFLTVKVVSAAAVQTQQYNKIFLDPFYRESMGQDVDYTYTINIDPPDRISEVKSAIITFQMWLNPTIEFFLTVDGQTCNTPSYEVHTTYAGAGEGTIFFDCSNVITEAGTYEVVLTPDDDTGAVTSWIDLTYMNDPKKTVQSVGGTEYSASEAARTVLHVLDNSNQPVNDVQCLMTVRDSRDDILIQNQTLNYITGSNGLYSYEFTTALPYGVYSVDASCDIDNETIYVADTFHVAEWTKPLDEANRLGGSFGGGSGPYEVKRVSGTAYDIGETAHVIVQVLQAGVPDNTAQCTVDIHKPVTAGSNDLVQVVDDGVMELIDGSNAIYKYDFANTTIPGSYVADTVCVASAIGNIPVNSTNNITDSTTSSILVDIDGTELTIETMKSGVPVVALASIEGVTDADAGANFSLDIDGLSYTIPRNIDDGEPGNIFLAHINPTVSPGSHTVVAQHATDAGTLDSKVNVLTFALEDDFVNIPFCTVRIDDELSENSQPMNDMVGINCTLELTQESDVLVLLTFAGEASVAGKSMAYTVAIDGVDQETAERNFASTNSPGALSFITLSNSELEPGTHQFQGRWGALGGTVTGTNFQLIVFANQAGNRRFSLGEDTLGSITSSESTPIDMGVEVPATINGDSFVAGLMSTSAQTGGANKEGFFGVNIDGVDGSFFGRWFPTKDKQGSISVVQTSPPLSTGFYNLKGRWYVEGGSSIQADNTKLIAMGFTTVSEFGAQYIGLDFVVNNQTAMGEGIAGEVWNYSSRTLTDFNFSVPVEINASEIAFAVWNYEGSILASLLDQLSASVWSYFNRSLTTFDFQVNASATVDTEAISIAVWGFDNRTLTEFPFNISATIEGEVNATAAEVFMGGTEYLQNQEGKLAIRLIRNQGGAGAVPETGASCNATILNPDETTYVNSLMSEFGNGVYTLDFTTTDTTGIFTYFADCSAGSRDYFSLNTFHVGLINGTSLALNTWTSTSRNLTFTEDQNITTQIVNVNNVTVEVVNQTVNVTTQIVNVNNVTVEVVNQTVNVTTQIVEVINQTINITNQIVNVNNVTVEVVNQTVNVTTQIVNVNNVTVEVVNQTINVTTQIVNVNNVTVNVQNVSLNVSEIWAFPNRTLTFTEDVTDYQKIQDIVWNATMRTLTDFNFTVDVDLEQIANAVWNATSKNLTFTDDVTDYDKIQAIVWNATIRTLTDFNFTVDVPLESIADAVWNATSRNLTYYEDVTDYDLINSGVWSFSNRSLTSFDFTVMTNINLSDVNSTEIANAVWNYQGEISNNIITTLGDYVVCLTTALFTEEEGWGVRIPVCLP